MCDVSFRLFCCACAAEIKAILEEGIAVDCPDENGYTPLYNATMYDKAPVVEFLIAQGAAVDVPNKNGERTHLSAISLPVLPSSSSVQPSLPPSLHLTTRAIASFVFVVSVVLGLSAISESSRGCCWEWNIVSTLCL